MLWTLISVVMLIASLFVKAFEIKVVMMVISGIFAIAGSIGYIGSKIEKLANTLAKK